MLSHQLRSLSHPAGAAGVTVAAAMLITACGSGAGAHTTATVNPARVATAIATSIARERHLHAAVTCPSGVRLETGLSFYCVAEVGAQITPFRVAQTAHGNVTFVGVAPAQTPLLATDRVAAAITASIEKSQGVRTTVRCPLDIPRQSGLMFVCSATRASGAVTAFTVRETDDSGHVTYQGA